MNYNLHNCNVIKYNSSRLPNFVNTFNNWTAPCVDVTSNVVNIVGIANFNNPLNLEFFNNNWKNAVYEPKKIPCVRIPLAFKDFNAVALVYNSGKVVITGVNHVDLVQKAFRTIALFYNQFVYDFGLPQFNFRFTNVVATANIKQNINLLLLPAADKNIKFDPETFPAAMFSANVFINAHATVLIYANGKLVVTGAKKVFLAHTIAQFTIRELLPRFNIKVDRFNDAF